MGEYQSFNKDDAARAIGAALRIAEGGLSCSVEVPSGMLVRHYRETLRAMARSPAIAKRVRIVVRTKTLK